MGLTHLLNGAVLSWLLPLCGCFPKAKFVKDRDSMRTLAERYEAGDVIVLFPEGTRTFDGRTRAALPGIGRLLELQEELPAPYSPTAARRPFIRAQMRELLQHVPEFVLERLMRDESVQNFLADTSVERQIAEQAARSRSLEGLVDAVGLGYVFVHPPYSAHAPIRNYLETGLPLEKFYERDGVLGYRVVRQADE